MSNRWNMPVLLGALLAFIAPAVLAQAPAPSDTFEPIPEAQKADYRFNFARVFFPDEKAFQDASAQLEKDIAEIEKLKGKVLDSPETLFRALKMSDDFDVLFGRVYVYQYLKYAINTQDTVNRDKPAEMAALLAPRLSFVNDEIQKITPEQMTKFLADYPPLQAYRYVLEESIRSRPHTLSLKEEELLARTSTLMTKWQGDQYDLLLERAEWGTVKDPEAGELHVRQDEGRIANSKDRNVRREGFRKLYEAYRSQRDLTAFTLINRARTRNELARIRQFKNALDSRFFDIHLTYDEVESTYNQILDKGVLRLRLQNLQRQRVKDFTGYETVQTYDMSLVPPGVEKPRFAINDASRVILDSVRYLGPEYHTEMAKLLDPKNGRLDIVSGPNRVPGAFTFTLAYMDSPFFAYGYEGYLQDVSTLAHEGGHAIHQALMNNAKIPAVTMDGPSFFTESFSIMNELVLHDRLYREEKDPGRNVYYLEQMLQQMLAFYGTTRIAAIEKAIYEGVDKGTIKTADDLDKLTLEIGRKTSIWHDIEPETNQMWQIVPHFYRSGTPYENYVFADLLAQTYLAMYHKDPADFAKRFTALQRNGFNDAPQVLLKKFMGVDLKDSRMFDAVFQQHERLLNELETLYKQVPVKKLTAAG